MGDSNITNPNNLPANISVGHNLNATQQGDLDQLNKLSQDAGAAEASGDKSKIKADHKQISDLLHKLGKDGFSKEDIKSIKGQLNSAGLTSNVAGALKSGKLHANDPKAASMLQADYQAFLTGKNFKPSDDAWNQFTQSITPELKGAGLSDDDVSKLLGNAKKASVPQGFPLAMLQNNRV